MAILMRADAFTSLSLAVVAAQEARTLGASEYPLEPADAQHMLVSKPVGLMICTDCDTMDIPTCSQHDQLLTRVYGLSGLGSGQQALRCSGLSRGMCMAQRPDGTQKCVSCGGAHVISNLARLAVSPLRMALVQLFVSATTAIKGNLHQYVMTPGTAP